MAHMLLNEGETYIKSIVLFMEGVCMSPSVTHVLREVHTPLCGHGSWAAWDRTWGMSVC